MNRQPIKLAILGCRGVPARYGGFETFAQELAVGLIPLGVEVTVYCEDHKGLQPASFRGIRLEYCFAPNWGVLSTIVYDALSLWHARKKYDVVYMLGYGVAPLCFIPRMWGRKVWLNVDGIEWARQKWGAVAKLYFRIMESLSVMTATRVIADAQGIKEHLTRRHKLRSQCSVIPYGAPIVDTPPDSAHLKDWDLVPDGYYLIVCRLEPENHILEMLEGFKASASRRQLIVVGNIAADTPHVRQLLTIKDPRIRFIGTVFDKEKLQALRYHAFVYCHGHSVGGTNPTLLEALGCGNAVLGHDNQFNREVAGAAGVYFTNAREFAKRIDELESGVANVPAMKAAGPKIISERYTWDIVVRQYLALLEAETGKQACAISSDVSAQSCLKGQSNVG